MKLQFLFEGSPKLLALTVSWRTAPRVVLCAMLCDQILCSAVEIAMLAKGRPKLLYNCAFDRHIPIETRSVP